MPPKKKGKKDEQKADPSHKSQAICGFQGPGPRYKLKPLVGYNDHCYSKYRNPAFTILGKQPMGLSRSGPGPIYNPEFPKTKGFSLGMPIRSRRPDCTPGPYDIPSPKPTPAFSLKWRTPLPAGNPSAGPYEIPRDLNGPKFSIGRRLRDLRRDTGPGPGPVPKTPRGPEFSLGKKPPGAVKQASPGPYDPVNLNKGPEFSFGIRHGPCVPPLITECDKSFQ